MDSNILDELKPILYTIASQVKLLIDVPELIWNALEKKQFFNAAILYTLSSALYHSCQTANAHFTVSQAFPIIHRQWDLIHGLKEDILEQSLSFLKESCLKNVEQAMYAVLLLTSCSLEDLLQTFLDAKKEQMFCVCEKSNQDIYQLFKSVITTFQSTVETVHALFYQLEGQNVCYIQKTLIQEQPNSDSSRLFGELFSDRTNIHLLFHYLPLTIKKYSPHFPSLSGTLNNLAIQKTMETWSLNVGLMLTEKMKPILDSIDSVDFLMSLRNNVLSIIDHIEETDDISSFVFGRDFSLWTDICRNIFMNQSIYFIDKCTQSLESKEELSSILIDLKSAPVVSVWESVDNHLDKSDPIQSLSKFLFDKVVSVRRTLQSLYSPCPQFDKKVAWQLNVDNQELLHRAKTQFSLSLHRLADTLKDCIDSAESTVHALYISQAARRFVALAMEKKGVFSFEVNIPEGSPVGSLTSLTEMRHSVGESNLNFMYYVAENQTIIQQKMFQLYLYGVGVWLDGTLFSLKDKGDYWNMDRSKLKYGWEGQFGMVLIFRAFNNLYDGNG
jgi:hypothetical protein